MDKLAVITGVGRGIGKATAQKFLAEGWEVIGTYSKDKPDYTHDKLQVHQLDITDDAAVRAFAQKVKALGRPVNVLVNNAGVLLDPEPEANADKIRRTFAVNVFGLVALTEQLLPLMSKGAHIVNISSRMGSFTTKPIEDTEATGYRMSKSALNMYTRLLAYRTKTQGVTVSALHPGWVDTHMGNILATTDEGPDRTPQDAAEDIYKLAISKPESGGFWFKGRPLGW